MVYESNNSPIVHTAFENKSFTPKLEENVVTVYNNKELYLSKWYDIEKRIIKCSDKYYVIKPEGVEELKTNIVNMEVSVSYNNKTHYVQQCETNADENQKRIYIGKQISFESFTDKDLESLFLKSGEGKISFNRQTDTKVVDIENGKEQSDIYYALYNKYGVEVLSTKSNPNMQVVLSSDSKDEQERKKKVNASLGEIITYKIKCIRESLYTGSWLNGL